MSNYRPRQAVWRGTSRLGRLDVALGLSWTTRREVACWFAVRWDGPDPFVLRRTVPRKWVRYFSDEQQEAEAVVVRAGPSEVDGAPDGWRAVAERIDGARWAELRARLRSHRT